MPANVVEVVRFASSPKFESESCAQFTDTVPNEGHGPEVKHAGAGVTTTPCPVNPMHELVVAVIFTQDTVTFVDPDPPLPALRIVRLSPR